MTEASAGRVERLEQLAREAAQLRVRLERVDAEYAALLASVGQYADRPDIRRAVMCTGCGHNTDHRYLRGEWVCVVCETVALQSRLTLVPDTDRQAV